MSEDTSLDEFLEGRSEHQPGNKEKIRGEGVPTDWDIETIDDVSERMGDGGTPSRQGDSDYFGGDITWVVVDDVEFEIEDSKEKLTEEGLNKSSASLWPEGAVIVTTGASIGEVGIAKQPTATKQGITGIVPTDKINSHFLGRYLEANEATLNRFAQGTTFEEIRPYVLRDVEMPVPSLSEQRKIATVLYTVDRAIEKTEEIISQIESVLSGVTEELLIEGYGEKELEQNQIYSFEFQMPTDWEVVEVQSLNKNSKPICYGIVQPGEYHEDGVPILNIEYSRYGAGINVDELHRVSPELHEKYSRSKLTGGEIVISVKGSTGEVGRVPSKIDEWNISRDLARISPDDNINRDWLRFYLSTELAQRFIHVNSPGSTRDSLNIGDLKQLPILLPPQDEQDQIVDVVAQVEDKLDSEKQYFNQLKRLKRGLMQDLLSGTVRTTDTNIEVPEEVAQYG